MDLFIIILLALKSMPNNAADEIYTEKSGSARIGKACQRLSVNTSLHCLITCTSSSDCHSINVIKNKTNNVLDCELFSCSLTFNEENKVIAFEPSTYYEIADKNINFYQTKQRMEQIRDCKELQLEGEMRTGVYLLNPTGSDVINVYCDMHTADGGWTVLQRRIDGTVDFYRNWISYKDGFGDICGEFWLGLDAAHELMKHGKTILRFDVWDGDKHYHFEYYNATIADETNNYRLYFNGTGGDSSISFDQHNNHEFTTKDRDNDDWVHNCAQQFKGGWWYDDCHAVNINGDYGSKSYGKGLSWYSITGFYHSLSKTEIKIKRIGY